MTQILLGSTDPPTLCIFDPDNPEKIACQRCGITGTIRRHWQSIVGGRKHIRLECCVCDGYIRFDSQTPEAIAEANWNEPYRSPAVQPSLYGGAP